MRFRCIIIFYHHYCCCNNYCCCYNYYHHYHSAKEILQNIQVLHLFCSCQEYLKKKICIGAMEESLDYVNKWIYNAAGCVPSMQHVDGLTHLRRTSFVSQTAWWSNAISNAATSWIKNKKQLLSLLCKQITASQIAAYQRLRLPTSMQSHYILWFSLSFSLSLSW